MWFQIKRKWQMEITTRDAKSEIIKGIQIEIFPK
jgi:hypothetical protein